MVCYDVTTMLSVRNSNIRRNFVFGVTFICLFIYLFIYCLSPLSLYMKFIGTFYVYICVIFIDKLGLEFESHCYYYRACYTPVFI